jgi:hypothetical protein
MWKIILKNKKRKKKSRLEDGFVKEPSQPKSLNY